MKRGRRTLPLGVDYGMQRVRVALVERDDRALPVLIGVAARTIDDDPVDALREALAELATDERRCVFGLGLPEAVLLPAAFPPMPPLERARAARFEADRRWNESGPTDVTLVPIAGKYALGIARRSALTRCVHAANRLRLHPVAIDDAGLALQRVYQSSAGAIDIGAAGTRVIVFTGPFPASRHVPSGGDALTEAIAQSFGLDPVSAEGASAPADSAAPPGCGVIP